jgi:hypothetical protein
MSARRYPRRRFVAVKNDSPQLPPRCRRWYRLQPAVIDGAAHAPGLSGPHAEARFIGGRI